MLLNGFLLVCLCYYLNVWIHVFKREVTSYIVYTVCVCANVSFSEHNDVYVIEYFSVFFASFSLAIVDWQGAWFWISVYHGIYASLWVMWVCVYECVRCGEVFLWLWLTSACLYVASVDFLSKQMDWVFTSFFWTAAHQVLKVCVCVRVCVREFGKISVCVYLVNSLHNVHLWPFSRRANEVATKLSVPNNSIFVCNQYEI